MQLKITSKQSGEKVKLGDKHCGALIRKKNLTKASDYVCYVLVKNSIFIIFCEAFLCAFWEMEQVEIRLEL